MIEVLVSVLLAGIAGGAIWLLGGPIMNVIDPAYEGLITEILDHLPSAVIGGIIGVALIGIFVEEAWFGRADSNV